MIVTVIKPLTDNTGIVPPWLMPDYREPIPTVPRPDDPIITDEESCERSGQDVTKRDETTEQENQQ